MILKIHKNFSKILLFSVIIVHQRNVVENQCSFIFQSTAHFPEQEENIKELVEKINGIQDARIRLDADLADKVSIIRTLIIKAEDAFLFDLYEYRFF